MRVFRILILSFSFFLAGNADAVDGYRDIKFEINLKQLKKLNKCSLSFEPAESNERLKLYSCSNFKFGKTVKQVMFYFIEDKLLRIVIQVGTESEDFIAFSQALTKKYKTPTFAPNAREMAAYDEMKSENVDMAWDQNTVILRIFRYANEQSVMVIYSSPKFESALLRSKTKGLEDAL